jgi:hypothetical protein
MLIQTHSATDASYGYKEWLVGETIDDFLALYPAISRRQIMAVLDSESLPVR